MCLIVFAHDAHPDYTLVFAANRDESYERSTAPAQFWKDAPDVLAGRDLKAGGTWMGATRAGSFAAVTNVRDPDRPRRENAPSRGALVSDYLRSDAAPGEYAARVGDRADRYNGFNLLVGAPGHMQYLSNRNGGTQEVTPGIHGLSNDRLDTPWPKVERAKAKLHTLADENRLTPEALLEMLTDRTIPPDDRLPDTGVPEKWERVLAPIFITSARYGTRSSTVLLIGRDGTITFVECTFQAGGEPVGTECYTFEIV